MSTDKLPRDQLEAAAARRLERLRCTSERPQPCTCPRCRPDLRDRDPFGHSAPDGAFIQAELPGVDSMGEP